MGFEKAKTGGCREAKTVTQAQRCYARSHNFPALLMGREGRASCLRAFLRSRWGVRETADVWRDARAHPSGIKSQVFVSFPCLPRGRRGARCISRFCDFAYTRAGTHEVSDCKAFRQSGVSLICKNARWDPQAKHVRREYHCDGRGCADKPGNVFMRGQSECTPVS